MRGGGAARFTCCSSTVVAYLNAVGRAKLPWLISIVKPDKLVKQSRTGFANVEQVRKHVTTHGDMLMQQHRELPQKSC